MRTRFRLQFFFFVLTSHEICGTSSEKLPDSKKKLKIVAVGVVVTAKTFQKILFEVCCGSDSNWPDKNQGSSGINSRLPRDLLDFSRHHMALLTLNIFYKTMLNYTDSAFSKIYKK